MLPSTDYYTILIVLIYAGYSFFIFRRYVVFKCVQDALKLIYSSDEMFNKHKHINNDISLMRILSVHKYRIEQLFPELFKS
jgi:hypothetical protein